MNLNVDELANHIRTIDGDHTMSAGELAEKILTFIQVPTYKLGENLATGDTLFWDSPNSHIVSINEDPLPGTDRHKHIREVHMSNGAYIVIYRDAKYRVS